MANDDSQISSRSSLSHGLLTKKQGIVTSLLDIRLREISLNHICFSTFPTRKTCYVANNHLPVSAIIALETATWYSMLLGRHFSCFNIAYIDLTKITSLYHRRPIKANISPSLAGFTNFTVHISTFFQKCSMRSGTQLTCPYSPLPLR